MTQKSDEESNLISCGLTPLKICNGLSSLASRKQICPRFWF